MGNGYRLCRQREKPQGCMCRWDGSGRALRANPGPGRPPVLPPAQDWKAYETKPLSVTEGWAPDPNRQPVGSLHLQRPTRSCGADPGADSARALDRTAEGAGAWPERPGWVTLAEKALGAGFGRGGPSLSRGQWAGPGRGAALAEGSRSGFAARLVVLLPLNAVEVVRARPEGAAAAAATWTSGAGEHPNGAEGAWRLRSTGRVCPSPGRGGSWDGGWGGGEDAPTGLGLLDDRFSLPPPLAVGLVPSLRLSDPATCCHGPGPPPSLGSLRSRWLGVSAMGTAGAVSGDGVPVSDAAVNALPERPERRSPRFVLLQGHSCRALWHLPPEWVVKAALYPGELNLCF